MPELRYMPAIALPPYSYVPGHDLPHPVNNPAGHLYATKQHALPEPPVSPDDLTHHDNWLYALDLFNAGFYWEAHEAWEAFWHALGRTSPEARFVQGLIHLAAAAAKIREGKPPGVSRHTQRARELLGEMKSGSLGGTLGLDPASISSVIAELEGYTPDCWHTSRTPVVRVLVAELRLLGPGV